MRRELRTEHGIFGMSFDWGELLALHFYIKCKCGGVDGAYLGSRLEKSKDSLVPKKQGYTFYMANDYVEDMIDEQTEQLLTLFCNDCDQEFKFDPRSYQGLIKTICEQGVPVDNDRNC